MKKGTKFCKRCHSTLTNQNDIDDGYHEMCYEAELAERQEDAKSTIG